MRTPSDSALPSAVAQPAAFHHEFRVLGNWGGSSNQITLYETATFFAKVVELVSSLHSFREDRQLKATTERQYRAEYRRRIFVA